LRRFFNFLRRHPPRDVAHLLTDVVSPVVRGEGLELGFDINSRLALKPGASNLVVERAVARAARRDAVQRRAIDDDAGQGRGAPG
jgi:hypothetical protein